MTHHVSNWAIGSICALFLLTPSVLPQEEPATPEAKQQAISKLAQEVRKQIVKQPLYGVFDAIHFAIEGDTVILRGYASRPALKSDIENSVKKIEGVNKVTNEIEVPLSERRPPPRRRVQEHIRLCTFAALHFQSRWTKRCPLGGP